MKLHDPETEKALMRMAKVALDGADFQKHPVSAWIRQLAGLATIALASALPAYALYSAWDGTTPLLLRQSVCAFAMMLLARLGAGQIAMSFAKASFFGAMVNLPITGSTALTFVRGIFLRKFWVPALLGSLAGAIFLHIPVNPDDFSEFLTTWFLLLAIVWSTATLAQTSWLNRFRIVKFWQWAVCFLIGSYFILNWLGEGSGDPPISAAAMEKFFASLLWIFPPVWVFPGRLMDGGFIPALFWISFGAWQWLRLPATGFPDYDRPRDFLSAFGTIGSADEADAPTPSEGIILPDPAPRPSTAGWVERLIAASIPAADLAAAGALMPASKYSRATNLTMAFGVVWLLAMGFGKSHTPDQPYRDFFQLMSWAIPAVVCAVCLMPYAPPLKGAVQPCPLGNTPVPFFTTLPISLRSLLRLTFRITIVRTVIAMAIATPLFWMLARIHQLPEIGSGLLAMIPAIGVAWILSVPAAISNRLDLHLRGKKGIFPLILATSLVQVPIGFLFVIASLAGIGFSFAWGMGETEGKYGIFLLPAALICLTLGGVMSRLLFEILHLSVRQRRYDWKSKIR